MKKSKMATLLVVSLILAFTIAIALAETTMEAEEYGFAGQAYTGKILTAGQTSLNAIGSVGAYAKSTTRTTNKGNSTYYCGAVVVEYNHNNVYQTGNSFYDSVAANSYISASIDRNYNSTDRYYTHRAIRYSVSTSYGANDYTVATRLTYILHQDSQN